MGVVLLSGAVFATKGISAKVRKGATDNPQWLNVSVTKNAGDLFTVAIHAKIRKGIAGYDLLLTVKKGELKGLNVPVEIIRVKPGYTAGMALPKSLLSNATLTLCEHLGAEDGSWAADGGGMYRIDLGSYLPAVTKKGPANKPNAPDKK